jgi:hypothetical protein
LLVIAATSVATLCVAGAPSPAEARPADPSADYVRWILTNVAGLQPSDTDVAAYVDLLDAGVSRVELTTFAVHHDQPLGFLVSLAYNTALGRELDGTGARYWVGQITSGRQTVAEVWAAIASSAEALRSNGGSAGPWVAAPYHLFLRRDPSQAEAAYWSSRATTAHGRHAVARAIHDSPEARRMFVRFLGGTLLGRQMDAAGVTYWSGQLSRLGELRFAARLLASDEMVRRIAGA